MFLLLSGRILGDALPASGLRVTRKVDIRLTDEGVQTPMAQGRSTKIISMIKWIRTSKLSIKISLSLILECTATTMLRMLSPRRLISREAGSSHPMHYKGTSIVRNSVPLGPYSRNMPKGGGCFS